MGHSIYEIFKIPKFRSNVLLSHDQTEGHESGCFYTMSVHKNCIKKKKYEAEAV